MNAPPEAITGQLPARPIPDSYWVIPGRFLAGEHPGSVSTRGGDGPSQALSRDRRSCFIDIDQSRRGTGLRGVPPSFATPDGRRITYLREPIPDHDVPAGRETMTRVLRMIEDALAGRSHRVPCIAARCRPQCDGRRLLACGSSSGQLDVIETLQALWRQSARSRVWSEVPETEDQVDYRPQLAWRCSPTGNAPGGAHARNARARRGHAARSRGRRSHSAHRFGAAAAPGTWTRHTSLALCLADSLVESRGFDAHDQMQRYLRWQSEGYLAAIAGQQQASRTSRARSRPIAGAGSRWPGRTIRGSRDGEPVATRSSRR
mgnify:CR=1 FL=1